LRENLGDWLSGYKDKKLTGYKEDIMDYIIVISGSAVAFIFSLLRDLQKQSKKSNYIAAYAAPDFSENKGKAIIRQW